jgi:hypothetical protein
MGSERGVKFLSRSKVDPQGGDYGAEVLSLESDSTLVLKWIECVRSTASGREHAVEAVGSRADAGQDDVAGCVEKKVVRPSQRCPLVTYLK